MFPLFIIMHGAISYHLSIHRTLRLIFFIISQILQIRAITFVLSAGRSGPEAGRLAQMPQLLAEEAVVIGEEKGKGDMRTSVPQRRTRIKRISFASPHAGADTVTCDHKTDSAAIEARTGLLIFLEIRYNLQQFGRLP